MPEDAKPLEAIRHIYYDLMEEMDEKDMSYEWVEGKLATEARKLGITPAAAMEAIRSYTEIGKDWPKEYLEYRRRDRTKDDKR